MIYVPLLKTNKAELNALSKISQTLSSNIMPLFEIMSTTSSANKDKNTLEYLSAMKLNGSFFVDSFRFSEGEYTQKNMNFPRMDWALKNRNQVNYVNSIMLVSDFFKERDCIPVISMKKGLILRKDDIINLISYIRDNKQPVCIRIESNIFPDFEDVLSELTSSDYLMLDIREQPVNSQEMTYRRLKRLNIPATKILLNSPRKREYLNTFYNKNGFTDQIDNSALELFEIIGFDGVGDYAGLKDKLPENSGGNGKGLAMAFVFCAEENAFWIAGNDNTNDGVKGYAAVKDELIKNRDLLDPGLRCPAFMEIERIKNGNWSNWIEITVIRYIDQIDNYYFK